MSSRARNSSRITRRKRPELEPTNCVECLLTWLLRGNGGMCLACRRRRVYWTGTS